MIEISLLSQIKKELKEVQESSYRHFAKQGSFSFYYCKDVDYFVKKAYDVVLEVFFEDFLPNNLPLCVCASKAYALSKLCPKQELSLLFVYKDLKAYKLRQLIKTMISLLEDLGFVLSYEIKELTSFKKDSLNFHLLNTRFLCGSKSIFKITKEKIQELKKERKKIKKELEKELNLSKIPFIKQEFNIKKDFGGLNFIYALDILFKLYKEELKESFDENNLSKLRLCSDFILSLASAMNLENKKESELFSLEQIENFCHILLIKDKKSKAARDLLLARAMSSLHFIGSFCANAFYILDEDRKRKDLNLSQAMQMLVEYEKKEEFSPHLAFELGKIKPQKEESLECLKLFLRLLYKQNSFYSLKLLLDSSLLKEFLKPFYEIRFLLDFEGEFSLCENAFLCLKEYEKNLNELQNLNKDELMILKLSILFAFLKEENELSLANVFRSYCAKLGLDLKLVDFGLLFCKNFFMMKEAILKDDIYNERLIFSLTSRLKNEKFLKILHKLSLISAIALKENDAFFLKNLDELLKNCLEALGEESLLDESTRRLKKEQILKRTKLFLSLDTGTQDRIKHIKSNLFFIKHSNEDIVRIALLATKEQNFILDTRQNLSLEFFAKKGFKLSNILISLSHLNLISMSFYELFDERIYVKFIYSDILSKEAVEKIQKLLQESLNRNFKALKKPNIKKDELKFDLNYSKSYAKLNLNSKDTKGFMAFVMDLFTKFDIRLSEARIQTVRKRTRNTFIFEKNELFLEKKDELIRSLTSE